MDSDFQMAILNGRGRKVKVKIQKSESENTNYPHREKTIPSDQALLGEGVGLTHPPRPADEPG